MALFHYFVHGKSCSVLLFYSTLHCEWVFTMGCFLVCVKIPTLPRGRSEQIRKSINMIIRDYHMRFWLSPLVSSRDLIISSRALARGMIMVEG